MTELWLPITDWSGYEVSDHGRWRSVDRVIRTSRGERYCQGRILRQFVDSKGYCYARARPHGKLVTRLIHALVLEAFVSPCPPGLECCHDDGNPGNNHVSNLRWDTHLANMADVRRHGRDPRLNRTICSRGHRLEQPNLDPRQLRLGKRLCRACRNAHATLTKRRRRGLFEDDREVALQECADRAYVKICAQAGWPQPWTIHSRA